MALGTVVVTQTNIKAAGEALYIDEVTIVGDSSYPTGGSLGLDTALQALTKDNREIIDVRTMGPGVNASQLLQWDRVNKKLMVLDDALAELADMSNDSTTTYRALIFSR